MQPEIDPSTVPEKINFFRDFFSWIPLMVLAIWGGTVSYITRIRKGKMPFSFIELVGEWTISGFAGVLAAMICYKYSMDFYTTAIACGISGHMGARSIGMIENYFTERAKRMAVGVEIEGSFEPIQPQPGERPAPPAPPPLRDVRGRSVE